MTTKTVHQSPIIRTFDDIRLDPDERGAVIGQTGTGKSTLSRTLLNGVKRVAIIDPKREFDFPECPVYSSLKMLKLRKPERFTFRPSEDDLQDLNLLSEVYRYCYNLGNITVYTDDVVGIVRRMTYPRYLGVCYQMGRSKKVAMLSCFQRPSALPLFMTSEAQKYYIFKLALKDDIKRVSEYCLGYTSNMLSDRHTFAYFDATTMDAAIPLKIKLRKG